MFSLGSTSSPSSLNIKREGSQQEKHHNLCRFFILSTHLITIKNVQKNAWSMSRYPVRYQCPAVELWHSKCRTTLNWIDKIGWHSGTVTQSRSISDPNMRSLKTSTVSNDFQECETVTVQTLSAVCVHSSIFCRLGRQCNGKKVRQGDQRVF